VSDKSSDSLHSSLTGENQIRSVLQSYQKIQEAIYFNTSNAELSTMERQIFEALISNACKMKYDPRSTGAGHERLDGENCPVLWIKRKNLSRWDSREVIGTYKYFYQAYDTTFKSLNDISGYDIESDINSKVIAGNSLGGRKTFSRKKKGFIQSQIFGTIEIEQDDDIISSYEPGKKTLWYGEKMLILRTARVSNTIRMHFDGEEEIFEINGITVQDKDLKDLLKNF
jgi:hypothetical protein